MTYLIEAPLRPDPEDDDSDFKADITFSYVPGAPPRISLVDGGDPGWPAEIDVVHVTPLGIVGPISKEDLHRLAWKWIMEEGGYYACCRHVEERRGDRE